MFLENYMNENKPLYLTLPKNTKGKCYILGDVHGDLHKVNQLLEYVGFTYQSDRLFVCGDLVDRGQYCYETALVLSPCSVKGNHDCMTIDYLQGSMNQWFYKGIPSQNNDWLRGLTVNQSEKVLDHLKNMPFVIRVEDDVPFNIFHAEFVGTDEELKSLFDDPEEFCKDLANVNELTVAQTLVMGRDLARAHRRGYKTPDLSGLSRCYVGHNVLREGPVFKSPYVYLDTGSYKETRDEKNGRDLDGYALTMVCHQTGEIFKCDRNGARSAGNFNF